MKTVWFVSIAHGVVSAGEAVLTVTGEAAGTKGHIGPSKARYYDGIPEKERRSS